MQAGRVVLLPVGYGAEDDVAFGDTDGRLVPGDEVYVYDGMAVNEVVGAWCPPYDGTMGPYVSVVKGGFGHQVMDEEEEDVEVVSSVICWAETGSRASGRTASRRKAMMMQTC